jgi:hypothetical protein
MPPDRAWGVNGDCPAVEADFAGEGAGRVDPVENLDQRRLARAVLAEKGVDFAAADTEVDAAERLDAREAFHDSRGHDDVVVAAGHHPAPL